MASLTVSSFDKGLKVYYTPQRVKLQAYPKNPFLALVPKMEEFKGKSLPIAIWYRAAQGVAAKFATAQANRDVGGYENFVLTRVKGYGLGRLENEVIEASRGEKAAFLEATREIDGTMHQVTRDLAIGLYRDPTGSRGLVGAYDTGTNVLTLTNRDDITNFEASMKLVFADPSTPTTLRNSGTAVTVSSVNRSAGTMVLSADPSGITANDLIVREGDIDATSAAYKISGLASWVPSTVTSTAFFGVDRTTDSDRLGGLRVTGTAMSIEDSLIEGAIKLGEAGAQPDTVLMNPNKFGRLVREMGSKVEHDIVKSPDMAKIGFKSVKLYSSAGVLDVIPDPNCQTDIAWMLTMDTWKLYTLGGAPKMLNIDDVGRWLRVADADEVEYRVGWYGQLGCNAPGHNARISLAS